MSTSPRLVDGLDLPSTLGGTTNLNRVGQNPTFGDAIANSGLTLSIGNLTVPDRIGVQRAWRVWNVVDHGGIVRLTSYTRRATWEPGQPFEAECTDGCNVAPTGGCSCGVYAARTLTHLRQLDYHRGAQALGTVRHWGKVIECEHGFRAQLAYPAQLWVPHALSRFVQPLRDAYLVPVTLSNPFGDDQPWR